MPLGVVSNNFLNCINQGGVVNLYTMINVYNNMAQPIQSLQNIPIESMTITANRQNTQRTTANLTVVLNSDYWPVPTDLGPDNLAPNGNELYIYGGFIYPGGATEYFLQGIFPIVTTSVAASGDLTMSVDADDRSWSVGRRGLLTPYTTPEDYSGDPIGTITETIYELLTQNQTALPPFTINIEATDQLAPANTYSVGQDPWEASQDLATSCGYELWFDNNGNCFGQSPPQPSQNTSPDWIIDTTNPNTLMCKTATRQLTADSVYNDYFVITENADSVDYESLPPQDMPPVQAESADTNPASPTWTGGPFGDIPDFIQSSVANDLIAAQQEAQLDLIVSLGQIDTIQAEGTINPAVQINDVVNVTIPRVGVVNVNYIVDGYTTVYEAGGTTTYQLRRIIDVTS